MTESEVSIIVASKAKLAGGVRSLAREWNISPAMISDLINGRRGPGPRVLEHLGLKKVKVVRFEKDTALARKKRTSE